MNLYEFVSIQEGLLIMGVLLLVVEVIFFGFATFFLLFIGISCLIAGLLMSFSIIPDTTLSALSSISIAVVAANTPPEASVVIVSATPDPAKLVTVISLLEI